MSQEEQQKRQKRLARKQQRVDGLAALLLTHEMMASPDLEYVAELRERLHVTKNQLVNMRP